MTDKANDATAPAEILEPIKLLETDLRPRGDLAEFLDFLLRTLAGRKP